MRLISNMEEGYIKKFPRPIVKYWEQLCKTYGTQLFCEKGTNFEYLGFENPKTYEKVYVALDAKGDGTYIYWFNGAPHNEFNMLRMLNLKAFV